MELYGNKIMSDGDLIKYKRLISDFVNGKVTVDDFEYSYLKMVKDEQKIFGDEIFKIIGTLFSDVDAYCGDPGLRDEDDIDENELLARAKSALEQLDNF